MKEERLGRISGTVAQRGSDGTQTFRCKKEEERQSVHLKPSGLEEPVRGPRFVKS